MPGFNDVLLVAAIPVAMVAMPSGGQEPTVEASRTLSRSFDFDASTPISIEIDNVHGSIDVVGVDGGSSAELLVHETRRGRTEEHLQKSRQEVELLVSQNGNEVVLFVDGPFRDRRYRGADHAGYDVGFDFALRVPRTSSLKLKTVNDGEIRVFGIAGRYDVENVNGGIAMAGISGSGRAYAVNGAVSALFDDNPDAASYFGSLNGDVSILFESDLAARLMVKTFNGDLYTDFPVSYLRDLPPLVPDARKGRRKLETRGYFGLQVGAGGGPTIELDAFNGDIRILEKGLTERR